MTKKYRCPNPNHEDSTPSANAYSDHFFCFGCGARGPLSQLGLKEGERIEVTYVEDVAATISYIKSLPRKTIRGFSLHCSPRGYYLLWPTEDYYKLRIEGADSGSKYRGPSGVKKPPFVLSANSERSRELVLVEGEFNALSLAALEGGYNVTSPGGAGDFYSATGRKHFPEYARYEMVYIVTDADAAGTQAAIETKAALITLGCSDVRIRLVEKDFNDIHTQDGLEALREECKRLGLI